MSVEVKEFKDGISTYWKDENGDHVTFVCTEAGISVIANCCTRGTIVLYPNYNTSVPITNDFSMRTL